MQCIPSHCFLQSTCGLADRLEAGRLEQKLEDLVLEVLDSRQMTELLMPPWGLLMRLK